MLITRKYEDFRAIRAIIVPIGENSLFEKHFEVVSKCDAISMIELNRPSDWKTTSSPFQAFRWNSGSILFDYQRFDRIGNGPGDYDNYQSCKRVLAVIGVINYPELVNPARVEDDLEIYAKRFPNALIRRVFVFNYSFDEGMGAIPTIPTSPIQAGKDLSTLIIFPPEMECEGGTSMIDIHLQEVMGHVAVNIIMALEKQVTDCINYIDHNGKMPQNLQLSITFEDSEDHKIDSQKKNSKKSLGRIRKWVGDICLQVSSPGDAIDHYAASIHESRINNDLLWIAGANEGYAGSIMLMIEMGIPPEQYLGLNLKQLPGLTMEGSAIRLVEEKALEALSIYSRSNTYKILEIECAMKIARLHTHISWIDREQKVTDSIIRAVAVPGLDLTQDIDVLLQSAMICKDIKLHRKHAWFLLLAAQQWSEAANEVGQQESFQIAMGLALIKACCIQYGIEIKSLLYIPQEGEISKQNSDDNTINKSKSMENNYDQSAQTGLKNHGNYSKVIWENSNDITTNSTSSHSKGNQSRKYVVASKPRSSWVGMRRVLLSQLAQLAKDQGDLTSCSGYLSALLRLCGQSETHRRQLRQLWSTESSLSPSDKPSPPSLPPTSPVPDESSPHNTRSRRSLQEVLGAPLAGRPGVIVSLDDMILKRSSFYVSQVAGALTDSASVHDMVSDDGMTSYTGRDSLGESRSVVRDFKGRKSLGGKLQPFLQNITNNNSSKRRLKAEVFKTYGSNSDNFLIFGIGTDFSFEEQDLILRSLEQVSAQLPPPHPLLLHALPLVHSVRPMLQTGSYLPHRIALTSSGGGKDAKSGEGNKTSSAFFYDPFAARAQRAKKMTTVSEVLWPLKERSYVTVILSNPLSSTMTISNARLLLEGTEYTAIPMCIHLPPYAKETEILFEIYPLSSGFLRIIGLEFMVLNAVYVAEVDSSGIGLTFPEEISEKWSYPRRIASMKSKDEAGKNKYLVKPDKTFPGVPTTAINIAPKTTPLRIIPEWKESVIELYLGEIRTDFITLVNESDIDINDIRISATQSDDVKRSTEPYDILGFSSSLSEKVPVRGAPTGISIECKDFWDHRNLLFGHYRDEPPVAPPASPSSPPPSKESLSATDSVLEKDKAASQTSVVKLPLRAYGGSVRFPLGFRGNLNKTGSEINELWTWVSEVNIGVDSTSDVLTEGTVPERPSSLVVSQPPELASEPKSNLGEILDTKDSLKDKENDGLEAQLSKDPNSKSDIQDVPVSQSLERVISLEEKDVENRNKNVIYFRRESLVLTVRMQVGIWVESITPKLEVLSNFQQVLEENLCQNRHMEAIRYTLGEENLSNIKVLSDSIYYIMRIRNSTPYQGYVHSKLNENIRQKYLSNSQLSSPVNSESTPLSDSFVYLSNPASPFKFHIRIPEQSRRNLIIEDRIYPHTASKDLINRNKSEILSQIQSLNWTVCDDRLDSPREGLLFIPPKLYEKFIMDTQETAMKVNDRDEIPPCKLNVVVMKGPGSIAVGSNLYYTCMSFHEIRATLSTTLSSANTSDLTTTVEIAFVIVNYYNSDVVIGHDSLDDPDSLFESQHNSEFIIVGHTRKFISLDLPRNRKTGPDSPPQDVNLRISHSINVCFTRANTYAIYTFIRRVSSAVSTVVEPKDSPCNNTSEPLLNYGPWWAPSRALLVVSRHSDSILAHSD